MGNIKDRLVAYCVVCGDAYPLARKTKAGKDTCMTCGDIRATEARSTWCVAPGSNKSNYVLVTDPAILKTYNPKRT